MKKSDIFFGLQCIIFHLKFLKYLLFLSCWCYFNAVITLAKKTFDFRCPWYSYVTTDSSKFS